MADKAPSVPRFSSVSRLHQPRSSGRSARQLYGGCADRPVACLHGDPSSSQPIGSDRFAADDLADFARDDPGYGRIIHGRGGLVVHVLIVVHYYTYLY